MGDQSANAYKWSPAILDQHRPRKKGKWSRRFGQSFIYQDLNLSERIVLVKPYGILGDVLICAICNYIGTINDMIAVVNKKKRKGFV